MKLFKSVLFGLLFIACIGFLTKPTDRKCVNETLSEIIEKTKSGNGVKDTIIAIVIQGNIKNRLNVEDFFLFKKVVYQSVALVKDGSLKTDNTKIAYGLFGNVFFQTKGLKEVILVNGL